MCDPGSMLVVMPKTIVSFASVPQAGADGGPRSSCTVCRGLLRPRPQRAGGGGGGGGHGRAGQGRGSGGGNRCGGGGGARCRGGEAVRCCSDMRQANTVCVLRSLATKAACSPAFMNVLPGSAGRGGPSPAGRIRPQRQPAAAEGAGGAHGGGCSTATWGTAHCQT